MLAPSSWLRLYGIGGLAATAVAVRRGERARLLGIPFRIAGALGEPATWRVLRHPSSDPLLTVIALANVALPLTAGATALRDRRT